MSKHTPGPWQVNHWDKFQVCDADGEVRGCSPIALCVEGTPAERAANAKLIAAAPALLAALQAIVDEAGPVFGHNDKPGSINRMARTARLALAKVRA